MFPLLRTTKLRWMGKLMHSPTTVLNGGVSMVIFFFVNKIIFPEGEAAKKTAE